MKIRLFTIPNLLTLCNLLCGVTAAVFALRYGDLSTAFALIILGAVFDFFDGFAARLLNGYSELGVQLDSLADMVTFGVAPAASLFVLGMGAEAWWIPAGWNLAWGTFVVAACAALRLARFNVDPSQSSEFLGLPTPAAALFCASLGMLSESEGLALPTEVILAVALLVAFLEVSSIRMFSLKFHGFGWSGNELRYLFLLLSLAMILLLGTYSIPLIIVLYVTISTVRWIAGTVSAKQRAEER